MPHSIARSRHAALNLPFSLTLGFAAVVVFFVLSGFVSYVNLRKIITDVGLTTRTHDTISLLDEFLSLLKDAETGQRGFVLTGDERYLTPYHVAVARIDSRLAELEQVLDPSTFRKDRFLSIKESTAAKLRELDTVIKIRRESGFDAARASVATDRGKVAMDEIRESVQFFKDTEEGIRAERMAEMQGAFGVATASGMISTFLGVVLTLAVGYLVRRAAIIQRRRDWIQKGTVGLSSALAGDQTPQEIGDAALRFLSQYLNAQAAAFFIRSGDGFDRIATFGVPADGGVPIRIEAGHGLLWQAAKDKRVFVLEDIPEDYLTIGSGLGRAKVGHLVITPVIFETEVVALLELGHLDTLIELANELLATASDFIARAVRAANYRAHLQNLLEETQRQAEELQAQGEELRVSNEELEEQGRALRESQVRLELQQAEVEQTNVQLEEQAQLLERQRDTLVEAQGTLQLKARELETASRYKSDFLANMSHELRTPLNSSLILAKLLADNARGNLNDEEVRYARTIQSAGNDLLTLINDILDLSKIEAGRMDVRPEPVAISELLDSLSLTFSPLAEQKGIVFLQQVEPNCPSTIDTDRQRLEQVLKNLLSNAFKFTESGEVAVEVRQTPEDRVAITVRDTGIGIADDQHEAIFEAFRQADGTTNRKYGGTGLGLSISRELARLLGGDLSLESEAGRGSSFTVTLPLSYDATLVRPRVSDGSSMSSIVEQQSVRSTAMAPVRRQMVSRKRIEDDKERLSGNAHVILVVEDDEPFARILLDLTRELDFQCLIAMTAEEALTIAAQFLPSAIILDIGLPDDSGLTVLDRLKHDSRTRHIPVHVVSAGDYAETAMALGAVGYMLKPVKRETLMEALGGLEKRLSRRLRRVLLVEDDPVQLESLQALLGSHSVETVGASTAAECLNRLKNETFDCMVLDLSLPDASGYSLLETLSREDAYSFPPVIVYTGRDLTADEEQALRRYSKSIIIKGAKSPERLLDEVTLFLHQVVSELPPEQQRMLEQARNRDAALEGKRILVVEDDVRNIFALTSVLEPRGVIVQIARNGLEALEALDLAAGEPSRRIDLVLMDVMMPEMDGLTATREIRKRPRSKGLPVIMLTAKAMADDQEKCISAGANDYMAKPLDVEKLLSLVRVWMPR